MTQPTEPLTVEREDKIRALLAAASAEGPWEHQCLGSEGCMVHIPGGTIRTRRPHVARFGHGEWKRDHTNAEFTAAAHEMLPDLLAELDRLRAALALTMPIVRVNDNRPTFEAPSCGVINPRQAATCTDPRPHDGDHRDAFGHAWPQRADDKPLFAEVSR